MAILDVATGLVRADELISADDLAPHRNDRLRLVGLAWADAVTVRVAFWDTPSTPQPPFEDQIRLVTVTAR